MTYGSLVPLVSLVLSFHQFISTKLNQSFCGLLCREVVALLEMDDQVEAGELLGGGKVLNAEQGRSGDNCDEERNYEDQHMTS